MNLAGVVVLYHPDPKVIENIMSYIEDLDVLYAVDNSEQAGISEIISNISQLPKVRYINNGGNKGISYALNIGAQKALEAEYLYLLTMDQDSSFPKGALKKLFAAITELDRKDNIGILSPFHGNKKNEKPFSQDDYSFIDSTMTSGNLLNLNAYKAVGEFREDYFIDYVDHEYCFRLRKAGYSIIQANNITLDHNLGSISLANKFGVSATFTNHNHIRRYYITRNRLSLAYEYRSLDRSFFLTAIKETAIETIKVILFEKNKSKKVNSTLLGIWHFLKGRYGKY